MRELASTPCLEARQLLAEVSVGLTVAQAAAAPKLFQLRRQLGEPVLVKLLVLILRAFIDSLRVPDKPDAADILELADTLAQTYTHDSLKDLILALKQARTGGTQFYQSLDVSKLYQLIADYFERKSQHLEHQHRDQKAHGPGHDANAVAQLTAAGTALPAIGRQLDPAHPNHESLRRKLTITTQREKRGLLTPAQAEEQRRQVQAANQRKPRPDWQPGPAAQRRIDARNRAEDKRLMDKYRPNPEA